MKKPAVPPTVASLPRGLQRFLYLTAAVTGAAIMIVEILGAKMLAPYVGTSHFVWTAQIAVTLLALATGYYVGGRWVDERPKLTGLYGGIAAAAVYLCVTTALVRPVAYACLDFRLALGSLLAAGALFFVPLSLLATVGPFLVRMLTVSLSGVGSNVGRLTALSTVGSVLGTVLIGYVLIPHLPNSYTMLLTAGLLFSVAAAYFLGWERRKSRWPALLLGLAAALVAGSLGIRREHRLELADSREVFRANSNFGLLQVLDSRAGTQRYYLNDYLIQNTYDTQEKQSLSVFTYMLHDLARAYSPRLESVLCIGLGVGIVPGQFAREGVQVDVVEINPAVLPVARRFFDCPLEQLQLFLGDGRHFLNQTTNRYHAIILDAFLGDSSPSHLFTREAFLSMQRVLEPGGTVVINCFAYFGPRRDFFGASLSKTLQSVFRSVRIHSSGSGNVFYVASDQAQLTPQQPPDFQQVHRYVREHSRAAFAGIVEANARHGIVLTDDYNPVEFYDAANREEIRRHLALSMRTR